MTTNQTEYSLELREAAYKTAFDFLDAHASRVDQMPKDWTYAHYETNKLQVNWLADTLKTFASQTIHSATRELEEKIERLTAIGAPFPPTVEKLEEQVRKLEAQLAECYRLSGADPDGDEDWRLAGSAVEEVRRLRSEYDEILDQLHPETPTNTEKLKDAVVEWQPIETAPKDGTFILGYSPMRHQAGWSPFEVLQWTHTWDSWTDEEVAGWQVSANDEYLFTPTHWMPLPEPPKALETYQKQKEGA